MKCNGDRKKAIVSLKKARGQIESVIKMLESDRYCVDVMNQNLAIIGLLKSSHKVVMEAHLNTCFSKAIASKDDSKKRKMIEEILTVMSLFNK